MSFNATVYNVMIASPGDVAGERIIIRDALHEWNAVNAIEKRIVLMPIGWDTHASPAMGARAQAIINRQIVDDADLLVAVFWTRLGSPTGESPSGTVEEIHEHVQANKPTMLYFSNEPVRLDSVDADQYEALKAFRKECKDMGLYMEYDSREDFSKKFPRQLALTIVREFSSVEADTSNDALGTSATVPTVTGDRGLSVEASTLLLEASKDRSGTIIRIRDSGGLTVQTNGKNLTPSRSPRDESTWYEAVEELKILGLIRDVSHSGEVFELTRSGWELADALSQQE